MPDAMVLLYGVVMLAPIVLFGIALWSRLEHWRKAAEIENRLRVRRAQRLVNPVPYLALVADGPRREAALRRRRNAA